MRQPGPESYPLAVATALLGLVPNTILSTSFLPLRTPVQDGLGTGASTVAVLLGLTSASYAIGAVTAAQIVQRHLGRRTFLVAEAGFVVSSLLAALAPDALLFGLGRIGQGFAAGTMLVTALPPLITRFGPERVGRSAAIVNIGIFGASMLGPMVGGLATHGSGATAGWRVLLMAAAALGAAGFAVALLGYPAYDPPDPERRVDAPLHVLVVVSTVATFAAASLASSLPLLSWQVAGLAGTGALALVALLVWEARRRDALIPIGALSTQVPITGLLVVLVGGAVCVTVTELLQTRLAAAGHDAWHAGLLFWPAPIGAGAAAVVFWRLFATRFVPVLVDVGLVLLVAAAALPLLTDRDGAVPWVALLLGLGAGSTVSPGLFLIGLGMASDRLGRAFALVQLLRSVATYAVAPVVLALAAGHGTSSDGTRDGLATMAAVAAIGLLVALALPAISGARLRTPDLAGWLDGGPAVPSPPAATHLRPGVDAETEEGAEPLVPPRLRRRR
jgi:MFS family permease